MPEKAVDHSSPQVEIAKRALTLKLENEQKKGDFAHSTNVGRRPRKSELAQLDAMRTRRHRLDSRARALADEDAEIEPDELVPDPQVAREFNITSMTLWRWTNDPKLGFPAQISIRKRNFRSRRQLETFKSLMLRRAIAARASEPEGA
jgi:hypothetical protein